MLFAYNWKLAIACLWGVPAAFILMFGSRKSSARNSEITKAAAVQVSDGIQETLENIREIRATNQEDRFLKALNDKIDHHESRMLHTELTNGIFYQFCMNAANHPDKEYFFIIDEINRGNMSKIFGELLMLIEKDYRGTKATLAYSGTAFSVPKNLYIIGMMNTADRSLAMIDYALRRRFSFFEMEPGFNSDGFKAYQASLQNETFNALIEQVIDLNREIKMDDSLGEGFRIGHSYFCGQETCTEEWMKSVVYYDIIPMLQEYWFDDKQKVQRWENNLSGVFNG